MQKQIVVPLDGSRLAEKALPHAVALARATGSGLTLLQVVSVPENISPPAWGAPPASAVSALRDELAGSARSYLQDVTLRLGDVVSPVQVEVLDGVAAETIIVYAEQRPEVIMIVMATRGRSGLTRWVLGSVAEKVLEASPVPLALIRPEVDAEHRAEPDATAFGRRALPPVPTYRTILVPLDYSVLAEEALPQATALAAAAGARLLLVSVLPLPYHIDLPAPPRAGGGPDADSAGAGTLLPPRQSVAKVLKELHDREQLALAEYLASVARRVAGTEPGEPGTPAMEVSTRVLEGDAAREILRAGWEGGADLIVMSTNGRDGLARLWLGHVAMKVVREARLPVLLVREQMVRHLEQPGQPK